jgi:serine/threonine-protein kinase HipA
MEVGRRMTAEVWLWGTLVGLVDQADSGSTTTFQFAPNYAEYGLDVSPLVMPLRREPYTFPHLEYRSFHGLPGLLADALPDKYGTALIDAWLASQGRAPGSFSPVERLCYMGKRAMGALEFEPQRGPRHDTTNVLDVAALVSLASNVLARRAAFSVHIDEQAQTIADILQIGTSAGGARAKALVAWDPTTREVRSGQLTAGDGFEYWLIKFDGVTGNSDKEFDDPQGYGAIEYAYHLMAVDAGITMMPCQLLEENGRRHFMTKRFDRTDGGDKLHMLTLGGIAHLDFNMAGAYSYEHAFLIQRQLGLPAPEQEQLYRRMVFNVVARNQDDHVKNISFLMDRSGRWSLAPAYDVTYAYNASGAWTSQHQMMIHGKRDGFTTDDLIEAAPSALVKPSRARDIIAEVCHAVSRWRDHAENVGVDEQLAAAIADVHRVYLTPR